MIYDILLIQPNMFNEDMLSGEKSVVFFLQEQAENITGENSVYKYQPLNKIVSFILSNYYDKYATFTGVARKGLKTKIISVYSPVGGAGKTTLSVNLSKQLAIKDYKVFYLNLEFLNTTSLYFQSSEDLPSLQVLYYLKARPERLLSKIESLKKFDEQSMVNYFDLPACPDEMISITKEEIKRLIQALIETDQYDYIVIDLDTSAHERISAAFEESNQVIWLLNNDLQSFEKTKAMLERMDVVFGQEHHLDEKVTYIMNRFTGQFPTEFIAYDLPISGYLPFISEWAQVSEPKQVFHHPFFNQELLSITEDIVAKNEDGVVID